MEYNSVKDLIENNLNELFAAEKKVAIFVLNNIQDVIKMNVSDLAKASRTSDATVIRTIKHLGFDGYYDFRIALGKDIGKYELISNSNISLTSIQKFLLIEAERINRLTSTLNFQQLLDISKMIMNSRFVHIIATGNTTPISTDLGFRLERIGIACTYSPMYEQYINHISLGSKDDCLIAISRSGKSNQVVRAIELAKKKGMKTIGITSYAKSTIFSNLDSTIIINEMNNTVSEIYHPDSHLQEMVINDILIYVISSIQKVDGRANISHDDIDTIGILLSEFKQS